MTFILPIHYGLPYPDRPGPTFDDVIRARHIKNMEEKQVRLVLVGDSALEKSVDTNKLSAAIETPSYAIAIPGSTSAFWYLAIKNLILSMQKKPDHVVVFFRDTILTLPNYHVNGGYIHELDEYATSSEEILIERAYIKFMNPIEKWALTWFPLYSSRQQTITSVNYYARNMLPGLLLDCRGGCTERADAVVYGVDQMRQEFRADALANEQNMLYTRDATNFEARLGDSFLPVIIRLTRENSIRLILVHERTLLFPAAAAEPKALQEYKHELADYLKAEGVPLIDFSYDPRLPAEYFTDVIHMNDVGKAAFTQLLADALKPLLP